MPAKRRALNAKTTSSTPNRTAYDPISQSKASAPADTIDAIQIVPFVVRRSAVSGVAK